MKLSIYSLKETLFEGEAEKIIARTPAGEISVLAHHVPIVTPLEGPELAIVDKTGKRDILNIVSGFLEVRPESEVVALIDQTS